MALNLSPSLTTLVENLSVGVTINTGLYVRPSDCNTLKPPWRVLVAVDNGDRCMPSSLSDSLYPGRGNPYFPPPVCP